MSSVSDFEKKVKSIIVSLPRIVGNETVKFFQAQMLKEKDVNDKDYSRRGYEREIQKGKRILSDRGNLFDSIEILSITGSKVVVGVNESIIAYADIHNDGGKIKVTAKMRSFFFAKSKYYERRPPSNASDADASDGDSDLEEMSDDERFYWNMAMKKVGSEIEIEKRQFIGESALLTEHLTKAVQDFIDYQLNSL